MLEDLLEMKIKYVWNQVEGPSYVPSFPEAHLFMN